MTSGKIVEDIRASKNRIAELTDELADERKKLQSLQADAHRELSKEIGIPHKHPRNTRKGASNGKHVTPVD